MVQKIWRGFWSRKNVHNFYLRKAYITTISSKGEAVRHELLDHYRLLQADSQQREAEARVEELADVVGNLHHLLSTASSRGVYNSPYHQASQATMFGLPVEEHLRNVAKGTLKQTLLQRTKTGAMSSHLSSARDDRATMPSDDFYAFATKPAQITRAQ